MEKQRSRFPRLCPTAAPPPGRKGARKRSPFNARAPGGMGSIASACLSGGRGFLPLPPPVPLPLRGMGEQGASGLRCGGDGGCIFRCLPLVAGRRTFYGCASRPCGRWRAHPARP